jgi:hypothetical protein
MRPLHSISGFLCELCVSVVNNPEEARPSDLQRSVADSSCIQRDPMPIGNFEKVRVAHVMATDQIDLAAKQAFEVLHQAEKAIGEAGGIPVELEEKIDVTATWIEIAADCRAEKLQLLDAIFPANGADLIQMSIQQLHHTDAIIVCAVAPDNVLRRHSARKCASPFPVASCRCRDAAPRFNPPAAASPGGDLQRPSVSA